MRLKLIRVSDTGIWAVDDNSEQIAVGSLKEAVSYLEQAHDVDAGQIRDAHAAIIKNHHNCADFGVIAGLFMYTSEYDVTEIQQSLRERKAAA